MAAAVATELAAHDGVYTGVDAVRARKTQLAFSWIFLVVGGAYGAHLSYSGQATADPLMAALRFGYGAWGLYWGVPPVLSWWLRRDFGPDLMPRLAKLLLGCFVVPVVGYLYGVLGGGLYQLVKTWWQSRG